MVKLNRNIPILYVLLGTSLSTSLFYWYMESMYFWLLSNAISVFIYTVIHNIEIFFSLFFRTAYCYMGDNKQCCCRGRCITVQDSTTWTVILRSVAGTVAFFSLFYTMWHIDNIQHVVTSLQILWTISSSFWLFSCIPNIICLVQCAAHLKNNEPKTIKVIKHFRTILALRIIHDVLLGVFWFYLAFRLDTLFDYDPDEYESIHAEEWRTIFMSMISWHLVIVLLREIYFSEKTRTFKGGCCDINNTWIWLKLARIGCLILIYTIVIYRVDQAILYTMGCSIYALIGGIIAIGLICAIHVELDNENFSETVLTWSSSSSVKNSPRVQIEDGLYNYRNLVF